MRAGWLAAGLTLAGLGVPALAQTASVAEVVVVAPTPLPGPRIDPDKLPVTVESLSSRDFARVGSLSITDALEQRVAGVSLADPQGNGFTRDFNFRGFRRRPCRARREGLAVYMAGCG